MQIQIDIKLNLCFKYAAHHCITSNGDLMVWIFYWVSIWIWIWILTRIEQITQNVVAFNCVASEINKNIKKTWYVNLQRLVINFNCFTRVDASLSLFLLRCLCLSFVVFIRAVLTASLIVMLVCVDSKCSFMWCVCSLGFVLCREQDVHMIQTIQ